LKTALANQQSAFNIAPNTRSVGWFLNYWLDHVVATDDETKPKTLKFYRYIAEQHLIPAIGSVPLGKLTPVHVQALVNDKRATVSERTGRPLSPRTVLGIRRTLHAALEQAVAGDFVRRNVAASKKGQRSRPRASTAVVKNAKFLQLDEARRLLASAAEEPAYYALFATILSLGLRLGEGLGLVWDDIDFSNSGA
jgi:integrase